MAMWMVWLVSIHGLLRALTVVGISYSWLDKFQSTGSYEPWPPSSFSSGATSIVSIHGLLRALTEMLTRYKQSDTFQSTGSYEPWLTSTLTIKQWWVSIHGLLRALTRYRSWFQSFSDVSIHGLLRALTAIPNKLFAKNCRIFYIIHNSNHNRK